VKAEPRPFFYPKFVRLLRGYRSADFFSDLSAGLTVGIIALPLAIGFGIASGVTPGQGLWTAIIGGLLISLLGGSRHQIGGPTGAFVSVLAAVLFLRRMEGVTQVRLLTAENDTETGANAVRGKDVPPGVVLFRFEGPLFFAAAEKLEFALRAHTGKPRIIILRMRHVPMMDATGMKALEVAWEKMNRDGVSVLVTAIQPQPMKVMFESGLADRIGMDNFCPDIDDALNRARKILGTAQDGAK
jgi:MFS superfamily sulfate permease-like transporter